MDLFYYLVGVDTYNISNTITISTLAGTIAIIRHIHINSNCEFNTFQWNMLGTFSAALICDHFNTPFKCWINYTRFFNIFSHCIEHCGVQMSRLELL